MTLTKKHICRHPVWYFLTPLLAVLLLVPDHRSAQTFTGQVTVIDGDTLKMGRKRIRAVRGRCPGKQADMPDCRWQGLVVRH